MADIASGSSELRTNEEYRIAIDLLLEEMKRLNEQMALDQQEIDRLNGEIRELKQAAAAIGARTDARLALLESMVPA